MLNDAKHTETLKVWLTEREIVDLMRIAAGDRLPAERPVFCCVNMNAPVRPFERFISSLPAHSARREPNYNLFEQLKREFVSTCPGASSAQYEAAVRAIAKATGV